MTNDLHDGLHVEEQDAVACCCSDDAHWQHDLELSGSARWSVSVRGTPRSSSGVDNEACYCGGPHQSDRGPHDGGSGYVCLFSTLWHWQNTVWISLPFPASASASGWATSRSRHRWRSVTVPQQVTDSCIWRLSHAEWGKGNFMHLSSAKLRALK